MYRIPNLLGYPVCTSFWCVMYVQSCKWFCATRGLGGHGRGSLCILARNRGFFRWTVCAFTHFDLTSLTTEPVLTLFENRQKCLIWIFQFWHFPPFFVYLKLTCLVTLLDHDIPKLAHCLKVPKNVSFEL